MKNLGQINDPKDIVTKEYVDEKMGEIENSILYTEQNLTEEQQTQARQNIGAVSEEEVINIIESGTEPQISATGELIDFTFEQETPITVISKINRDSSWGLSNQLTLHQVKGRNFVNLSDYVGEPGTVFEANGVTAILNDNGTLFVSGTNTGTGWATLIRTSISSGDVAARVYPPGTYTIPSGVTIRICSAKYPANETISGFANLEGTKTIPVPFRVSFIMYEVAKGVTIDKTIPFGLYRDKPVPTTDYEYCGNIYTATFDQPVYEGEFNWTTGELKDIEGNTVGYYKTPEIVGMEGDNHFWTGFGENIITNLQQKEKTLVQLNETVPEGSMPSICDFEFKPTTPLCIYDLANPKVMPNAQFNGHEIPLLTTKGDFIVYDKDKNIKLKKYIDSMFNVSRLDWDLSDKLTQNGIEKVWSKKFYLSKEDYTYTYNGTNSIYTFEFDEAEFSETGIPAKEDNIPIVTSCFYTGSDIQSWLNDRVWGGQPFPLKFSYNAETKKYIITIRGVGDNLIKYQLQEYSKAYIYYKLETPYNKNEFLALGLEAGDTFSFVENKTEIQPYLDATSFFRYNAKGNAIDDTTDLDITPKFSATVPQNTTTALIGFSNAAKIFNNGQTAEKEAAQDYSWIGDGDGTTDYTLLLKNKIKELNSVSNGGTIYLGNGTYKVSSFLELTDNIKLIGTGNTTIQQTNKYEHAIVISGSNIAIKDLKLKLYAMTAEEKDNIQYNPELTACIYINSNNPKTSSDYNSKYLDNMYCKNLTVDNVHLSGSYGFRYVDGYPIISNDYEHYRGCGLIQERLFFNYATLTNVHISGMYHGLHGVGGSNDMTIFCESCKTMVYGNGGYIDLNIYGHSYYAQDKNNNTISMSDFVGEFIQFETSYVKEYVYDTQWMKHIYYFGGKTMNNRYIVSQIGGTSYYGNGGEEGKSWKLKQEVIDLGRGNRHADLFQNRPFHAGNIYFDLTGQTSLKEVDVLTQNAISGAGVWGNGITSNVPFSGNLPLSEICRYPKEQQQLDYELLSALSTTSPSTETPIDIIIDISNNPVNAFQSCFLQFDHRHVASDFTVSFDVKNDNQYKHTITVSNNQNVICYFNSHQNGSIKVYKIKISFTKALHIHELKYINSAYIDYTKDYNHDELVGICNFGIISSDYNGRSFISECGGKVYGNLILNKDSTIKNVPNPIDDTDAVNKSYVDNYILQLEQRIEQLEAQLAGVETQLAEI